GPDVLFLEECVISQNFLVRGTRGEKLEQIHHPEAGAADAGTSATLTGFDRDALKWIHDWKVTSELGAWPAWFPALALRERSAPDICSLATPSSKWATARCPIGEADESSAVELMRTAIGAPAVAPFGPRAMAREAPGKA